jgi:glutamate-1-semialdehyde aminotransferase/predicted aldo/keto reductase-like oxidoreductase
VPERQAIETCKRAFALGINLVNAEPEYEGAYAILRRAIDESDPDLNVLLSIQTGGTREQFERAFESACEAFGRERIDLFGVTSISDQEAFGANVWGAGGLAEYLQRLKEEGRITGIFGSDHGSPAQMREILSRDVFDVLMLAYNPLGHHLVTFRASTVWTFETPPAPIPHYEREDLRRTKTEIIPLARSRDVGILLMKPLAGGLLCEGKAFPGYRYREGLPDKPSPAAVLRYLLDTEEVAAVVPGMASPEEVEENLRECMVDSAALERQFHALSTVTCSRCGDCDDLCSRGLPVSYLFRAAYHYLYPTAPFGISTTLQYFRLHPWEEARCASCTNQTCRCGSRIDIPSELIAIHSKMLELRDAGVVPAADTSNADFQTGEPYSAKLLSREVHTDRAIFHIRNTGNLPWPEGFPLEVYLNGVWFCRSGLRQPVYPLGDGHFAFSMPVWEGPREVKVALGDFWSATIGERPDYLVRYVEHNAASSYPEGTRVLFRVLVENAGKAIWLGNPADQKFAGLTLHINGEYAAVGRLSCAELGPGQRAEYQVSALIPAAGEHEFRFDMAVNGQFWFRDRGCETLDLRVTATAGPRTDTDLLLAISERRNRWFFSPGMGVYRSSGEPTFPVFAESARGCTLTDVDGRSFTDILMGWGCSLLGYGEPRVQESVERAIRSGGGVLSLPHRLEMEVCEALCSHFPWGSEAIFGKNGSDATTWAVRTARVATGRKVIIGCGYFGWADWFVGVQGIAGTGVPAGNNLYFVPVPYLDINALEAAVAGNADDLAAILVEPAAMCVTPTDPQHWKDGPFFVRARDLAAKHDALLIFDEIMSGFRFRSGSAAAAFGVVPDMTCLGKALANGMPLSAVVSRAGLLQTYSNRIYYAATMKGETHSFAAAKAALKIYAAEPVSREVWAAGECIRSGVREACRALSLNAGLIGPPYRMYLKFFDLEAESEQDVVLHSLVQQELARNGVISVKGYVIVSRAHDDEATARVVAAYTKALGVVARAIAAGSAIRFLEIPNLPIERRTAVASEKQL